jgi:chaperone modulatory protein CbpM
MADQNIPGDDLLALEGLSLEQVAVICRVERNWLVANLERGLVADAQPAGDEWRLTPAALARVRRMRQIERDFDAEPELAALVADLLEELDRLRARLGGAGLG